MSSQSLQVWDGFLWITALLFPILLNAETTVFTYQGRLQDGTNGASGHYDFAFSVWTQPSGPAQIGDTITNSATQVSNGLFMATLDFGDGVFDGGQRWLQIAVRRNSLGDFTVLAPRRLITAAPYAVHAANVNAVGITGTIPASIIGNGTITSNMLAPGAAAGNLASSGQSAVPGGTVVFSSTDTDTNLIGAGYVRLGGYVYAPNLWRERASNSLIAPRTGQAAIWTGSKMVVWGGNCGNDNPNNPPPNVRFTDGSAYDPVANMWTVLATNGAPAGREEFTSVWTGSEMVIWGGYLYDGSYHYFSDGASYNQVSNTWVAVTTNNAPAARYRHTAVWAGTEMIVWGGISSDSSGFQLTVFRDGGRFNRTSNTWSPINTNGGPSARANHTAVWTGTEMIIWGGQGGSGLNTFFSDGARYNPATDSWSPVTSTNAPSGRARHTAVWTGSEMIVWGGLNGGPYQETGAHYNPVTDVWTATDYAFAPAGRIWHTAIWTGREMIVWGGQCLGSSFPCNDGGSYNPTTKTWTPMATSPRPPLGRINHSAVWTGREMIICYGSESSGNCLGDTWSCTPPQLLYLYQRP